MNRCIASAMNLLALYIISSCVRVHSPRLLRCLAVPQCQISIVQKDNRQSQFMMKSIIDGGIY